MSMTIILQRDYKANSLVTFGKIYLPWLKVQSDIYTIELKDGDGLSGSCIMSGIYECIPHDTENHHNTWEVLNVPKRTSILIHAGNFASSVRLQGQQIHNSDTEGCILVGFGIEENIPMITRSKEAMDYLRTTLGIKSNFKIDIRD